jgi:hypothetical protein
MPVLLETDDVHAVNGLYLDGNESGNAIAAWEQSDGSQVSAWVNRRTAAAGWGKAELAEMNTQGDARTRGVALSKNGEALILWEQGGASPSATRTWAARYLPASGWMTGRNVQSLDESAGPRAVALDDAGDGIVVWTQYDGTRLNLWATTLVGGVWGTAAPIETNDAYVNNVSLAMNGAGKGIVTWDQSDGMRQRIWANTYDKGTGFQTAAILESTTSGDARNGWLAIDDKGDALAFWSRTGTIATLYAHRRAAGAWSATATTIASGLSNEFWPRFDFDATGAGRLVWSESGSYAGQGDTGSNNVFTRSFGAAGSWGAVGVVENDSRSVNGSSPPRIAVDAAGNAVCVWVQTDGNHFHVWANRYRAGVGWSGREQVENNATDAAWPLVVLDGSGRATTAWLQDSAGKLSIWASTFE